jgi:hypothetical protein
VTDRGSHAGTVAGTEEADQPLTDRIRRGVREVSVHELAERGVDACLGAGSAASLEQPSSAMPTDCLIRKAALPLARRANDERKRGRSMARAVERIAQVPEFGLAPDEGDLLYPIPRGELGEAPRVDFTEPLQAKSSQRLESAHPARGFVAGRSDNDLARRRVLLEARSDVDALANRHSLAVIHGGEIDKRLAGLDANPDAQPGSRRRRFG